MIKAFLAPKKRETLRYKEKSKGKNERIRHSLCQSICGGESGSNYPTGPSDWPASSQSPRIMLSKIKSRRRRSSVMQHHLLNVDPLSFKPYMPFYVDLLGKEVKKQHFSV
uniref:Uncharacterized protein n=1 Tax=Sphaerodactylus townsendi TaxID=933632 RepID=A0ACB8ER02_9SAUR